ncbi:MAG: DNA-binding protein [Candidatus Tokpelaia sp. JSC085]|nr:MAG: DNA-binding protein [Candidatus Tokpelaia sp. JSC085]
MNKKELISSVAAMADFPKKQAAAAVDAFINSVMNTLKKGEDVRLPGFGSFEVARRGASRGINPSTRETFNIPARNIPKFKPGNILKKVVNGQE